MGKITRIISHPYFITLQLSISIQINYLLITKFTDTQNIDCEQLLDEMEVVENLQTALRDAELSLYFEDSGKCLLLSTPVPYLMLLY